MNSSEDTASLHEEKYHSLLEGAKARYNKSHSRKHSKDKRTARKSSSIGGESSSSSRKPAKSGKPDHIRNSVVHEEYMESHVAGEAMQPQAVASNEKGTSPEKKRMDRFVEILEHMDVKGRFVLDPENRKGEAKQHHLQNYQHYNPMGCGYSSAAHSSPIMASPAVAATLAHARKPSNRSVGSLPTLPTENSTPLVQPRVPQVFSQAPPGVTFSHGSSPLGQVLSTSLRASNTASTLLPARDSCASFQTAGSTLPHSVSLADTSEPSAEASVTQSSIGTSIMGGVSSDSALPAAAGSGTSPPVAGSSGFSVRISQDFVSGDSPTQPSRISSAALSGRKSHRSSLGGGALSGALSGPQLSGAEGGSGGGGSRPKHRRLDSVNSDCPSAVGENLELRLSDSSGEASAQHCSAPAGAGAAPAAPAAAAAAAPAAQQRPAAAAAVATAAAPSSSSAAAAASRAPAATSPVRPVSRPLFPATQNMFGLLMGCVSRDPNVLSRRARKSRNRRNAAANSGPPPAPTPVAVPASAKGATAAASAGASAAAAAAVTDDASSTRCTSQCDETQSPAEYDTTGEDACNSQRAASPLPSSNAPVVEGVLSESNGGMVLSGDTAAADVEESDTVSPVDTLATSSIHADIAEQALAGMGSVEASGSNGNSGVGVQGVQLPSVFEEATSSVGLPEEGWELPKTKRAGRKAQKEPKTPASTSCHVRDNSSGSVHDSVSVAGSQKSACHGGPTDLKNVRLSGADDAPSETAAGDTGKISKTSSQGVEPVSRQLSLPSPHVAYAAAGTPPATLPATLNNVHTNANAFAATRGGGAVMSPVPLLTLGGGSNAPTSNANGANVGNGRRQGGRGFRKQLSVSTTERGAHASLAAQLAATSAVFSHPVVVQADACTSSTGTLTPGSLTPTSAAVTPVHGGAHEPRSRGPPGGAGALRAAQPSARRRSSSGTRSSTPHNKPKRGSSTSTNSAYPTARPASYSAAVASNAPVATPRSELTVAIQGNGTVHPPAPVRTHAPLDPQSPGGLGLPTAASPKSPLSLPPAQGSPPKHPPGVTPLGEHPVPVLVPPFVLGAPTSAPPVTTAPMAVTGASTTTGASADTTTMSTMCFATVAAPTSTASAAAAAAAAAPSMHDVLQNAMANAPPMMFQVSPTPQQPSVATGVFAAPYMTLEPCVATVAAPALNTTKLAPCGSTHSHSSDPGTPHAFCATSNCALPTVSHLPPPSLPLHLEASDTDASASAARMGAGGAYATFPGAHAWPTSDRAADKAIVATGGSSPFGSPMQPSILSTHPLISSPEASALQNGHSNPNSNSNSNSNSADVNRSIPTDATAIAVTKPYVPDNEDRIPFALPGTTAFSNTMRSAKTQLHSSKHQGGSPHACSSPGSVRSARSARVSEASAVSEGHRSRESSGRVSEGSGEDGTGSLMTSDRGDWDQAGGNTNNMNKGDNAQNTENQLGAQPRDQNVFLTPLASLSTSVASPQQQQPPSLQRQQQQQQQSRDVSNAVDSTSGGLGWVPMGPARGVSAGYGVPPPATQGPQQQVKWAQVIKGLPRAHALQQQQNRQMQAALGTATAAAAAAAAAAPAHMQHQQQQQRQHQAAAAPAATVAAAPAGSPAATGAAAAAAAATAAAASPAPVRQFSLFLPADDPPPSNPTPPPYTHLGGSTEHSSLSSSVAASLPPVATQGTPRSGMHATVSGGMVASPSAAFSDLSASASQPLGLDSSGQFAWRTAGFSMSEPQMSPTQISCNSAFLCTSPSAATFTQDGPSSDSNPLDGGSANPPSEAPLRLPEKPNQRVFNYVEDQLQRHMHMPYQLWAGSELRSIEEHVVALDVILQVVEASMTSAMNDEEGEDDMHCGNETLAAFMLHHCMHVNLNGYSKISPFRHRTAQGLVVGGADRRRPYPSRSERQEFYEEANKFTRMDMNTKDALSTLANLAQVEADTGEAPEDDATARPQAEKDHLAARLLFLCTTVLTKHVQNCTRDGEPEKALGAFRSVLKRLERFVALDKDPLSLHSLGEGCPSMHEFKLVFDPPDFQMRPPVVGCFVILLLSRLMEITRDLLCTAIDAFPPETPYPDTQRECLQEVYAFWERLANMAKSICEQISERLLRKERVGQFATRFRPDGLSWSVVLQSANSHFVNGWDGPQSSSHRGFKGGLLQHTAFALIDGARHHAAYMPVTCEGSIQTHPHLADIANRSANDANNAILLIMHKQLSTVNGAFKTLKELLDPPNAEHPADVNKEALERMVDEFRTQRYDGHTRQLTLFVKNLSSFFDVVSNIVRMIQDFEENRLLPPEAYMHCETYSNLATLLENTFLNYMSAWGHTLQLFSMYFSRDFKWDASSHQFKEWCDRSQGFFARMRGVTRATIATLESQLQASIDLARNLIHCKSVRASGNSDSMEDWPDTYQELPRMWIRGVTFLEMTLKDLLAHHDHSGDLDSIRSGVDHELSERTERQVRDVFYLDSARSAACAAPEMPTLDELTNDIIQQRTLPEDEQKVAPARSTLGTICKHVVYPRAQDRARLRPVPVAIKWIEVYAGTTGSTAMPNGISSKDRWKALCAEWGSLLTVRNSLLRGADGDSDASPPTPAQVILEEVNVVIGLALHGNGLSHNDVRALMARTAPPLEEVRVRKRVGIVFEWLPNGSLEDLLLYIRPPSRLSSRTHRKQLTPKLVLDCQAPRWASSASPGANGSANNGANGAVAARQRLPDDLANCPVSEFMTMPCNRDAIAALGHDWIRAIIPPPTGEHCLPRYTSDKVSTSLSLFSSRLGVFRSVVTFPACKEPLTDPEDPDAMYRIPTLFVFSFGWTLQLMLQFAKGVALCHRVGVVHRDLEPWNLMFDRFGRAKLIDFGFARHTVDPGRGSVGRLDNELYAAPECRVAVPDEPLPMPDSTDEDYVTVNHGEFDLPRTLEGHKATDVWTMGVVFWQMITLQPATGMLIEALMRISKLREKLEEDGLIQADVQNATQKLLKLGLSETRAAQEAECVPPLPSARYVRPAVFPKSRGADEKKWYRDSEDGGYRRLRSLIVEMLSVDARDRPSALRTAQTLNQLLADYQSML